MPDMQEGPRFDRAATEAAPGDCSEAVHVNRSGSQSIQLLVEILAKSAGAAHARQRLNVLTD